MSFRGAAIMGAVLAAITADPALARGSRSGVSFTAAQAEPRCTALAGKAVPASAMGEPTSGAIITSARFRPAGSIDPQGADPGVRYAAPDFCEVLFDIKPLDPKAPLIHSQVNLPAQWNGKKLQFGGSGYNGFLQTGIQPSRNAPPAAPLPLARGYMTAGTDSGHQIALPRKAAVDGRGGGAAGDDPRAAAARQYAFATNDEALRNFGYAAYKKTHDASVAIGVMFYGRRPARSYYLGGSEGGREGLVMAQKYPHDFDGIAVIDPVMNWTGLQTMSNFIGGQMQSGSGAWLGPKLPLLSQVVLKTCDAHDGLADKVISNPAACVSPVAKAMDGLRCASGGDEGPSCFANAQLAVIKAAYAGYRFPFPLANGVTHYAGYYPGGEDLPGGWGRWQAGTVQPTRENSDAPVTSRLYQLGSVYVRHFIARDPGFDPLNYDPAKFRDRVLEVSSIMDATDPDLSAFRARGGKLILREDIADAGQAPRNPLDYYDAVSRKLGKKATSGFFAAFVAAGLPHTSGGIEAGSPGAPSYGIAGRIDLLSLLEDWVERGRKPKSKQMLTLHDKADPHRVTASRPMCSYGTWPVFTGKGKESDGNRYSCRR